MKKKLYFYGTGKTQIKYTIKDYAAGTLSETDLDETAIRINFIRNTRIFFRDSWFFNYNDIKIVLSETNQRATMYLNIEFYKQPQIATYDVYSNGDVAVKVEVYIPNKFDSSAKKVKEYDLNRGGMTISKADMKIFGKFADNFNLYNDEIRIVGSFDVMLEEMDFFFKKRYY